MKQKFLHFAAALFCLTAVFCCFRLYQYADELREQTDQFEELADLVNGDTTDGGSNAASESESGKYDELYLLNPDLVGWISIPDTTIDYPVMQTVDAPDYYLQHDFNREYSSLGVPYVQANCDLAASDNIIIYGHHISGGRMFGALESYKSESFFAEHPVICFDTLTEEGQYQIIAVFKTTVYNTTGFRYYDFVDAADEEEFDAYVSECKRLALYDTGISAGYGDRLITLSTCEYSAKNGRLVVVAKKTS